MKFLRKTSKYTVFDHKIKSRYPILNAFHTRPDVVQTNNCNNKWIQRVSRMGRPRYVHAVTNYKTDRKNEPRTSINIETLECCVETGMGREAKVLESVMIIMMMMNYLISPHIYCIINMILPLSPIFPYS
jgi:hypothetical protein